MLVDRPPLPLLAHVKANLAYRLCFGTLPSPELTFTPYDDTDSCEIAIIAYFSSLYSKKVNHYLKERYHSAYEALCWFDQRYPTLPE